MSEVFSIDALVGVGDGAPAQLALRGITPNPARHELRVSFSLVDSKAASLALFDVSGRQIAARRVDGMGPGWRSVTLSERSSLPAGLYIIRLQPGRGGASRPARPSFDEVARFASKHFESPGGHPPRVALGSRRM